MGHAMYRSVLYHELGHHFTLPAVQPVTYDGSWRQRQRTEENRAWLWAGAHLLRTSDWEWLTVDPPGSSDELAFYWRVSREALYWIFRARRISLMARSGQLDYAFLLGCSGPRGPEVPVERCTHPWLCCKCAYWHLLCQPCRGGLCPEKEENWQRYARIHRAWHVRRTLDALDQPPPGYP